ncbi:sialic acid-binding Ig-like lectin 5 isoform X2 [Siphateles boraxobius]|uniref:sialic acid-binding Ig-like lectin 5 isoform X2 n=1 Tax=Siphateles boraxobius TaxID=180520 RepID=UPI004062F50C
MGVAEKVCVFVFLLQGVCCRDFSISLPEKIEALSGSCVIIKCTFEIKKADDKDLTERDATGLWRRDGTNDVVFNSRDHKPNYFKGNITGKLHEKNCTTIFYDVSSNHNGKYYFRIESGRLKYSYIKSTSTVNVIESPPKPTVRLYKDQDEDEDQDQDQDEVLEGKSVSLRCSAETLCSSPPPTLTWSFTPRIPLSESSRQQELLISDLNFTATHRHHRVTFTCTITYQLQDKNKTAQDNITLHVQYSPKNTSVSVLPSSSVLEGCSVTLTCSSDANPAVLNYTWSRWSERELLQTGNTLTFNRTDPTQSGFYHCKAQNKHGYQESSVMLDIQYAPQISTSSSCDNVPVCFCEVDGNPSPELVWHLSGRPVTNSSNMFIIEERLNSTGLRSSITLHQSLSHTYILKCVGNNTHGTASQLFQLSLNLFSQEASLFNVYTVLVGFVAGATFMAILWVTTLLYKCICRTQRGDKTGPIQTDVVDSVDSREEPFYVNKVMLSAEAPTINHPETLHYSTINFNNTKPESKDIKGISSLTVDYAVVRYCGRNVADSEAKITGVSSMPYEDTIYQVPHKARRRADMDVKQGESI